ncbi:hypothetical protein N7519_004975 [Penicillium mononematosum]|uniref:uncharacterized protein n=1 Tax=Penicillium mononematosum TaxID=268346 RepID=UPI0025478EF1|nr:uncharacterized protein N7519_004975 [Penicillium mononematosum]KAJ6183674.1 hypothetical protein N7519_004975 [Penicillium mononematosum]
MSELRQRPTATSKSSNGPDKEPTPRQHTINDETDQDHGISLLDIIRVIVTLLIACGGLSYYMTSSESVLWGYRPWYTRWPVVKQWVVCETRRSTRPCYPDTKPTFPLQWHRHQPPPLRRGERDHLRCLGKPYDLRTGRELQLLRGRDATRAFVTGCFKEDLTNDLRGVEVMFLPVEDVEEEGVTSAQRKIRREKELRAARARVEETVKRWTGFFANHAKYFEAGRVIEDGGVHGEPWPLCESAQKQRPKRSAMMEKS